MGLIPVCFMKILWQILRNVLELWEPEYIYSIYEKMSRVSDDDLQFLDLICLKKL